MSHSKFKFFERKPVNLHRLALVGLPCHHGHRIFGQVKLRGEELAKPLVGAAILGRALHTDFQVVAQPSHDLVPRGVRHDFDSDLAGVHYAANLPAQRLQSKHKRPPKNGAKY